MDKQLLIKCIHKWSENQWTGDECMSKIVREFGTRTYTVNLSYEVTVEAHDDFEAKALALHWFNQVMERSVDEVDLPDEVHSVDLSPRRDIVFVGGLKVE